jgi:hypothetical protein
MRTHRDELQTILELACLTNDRDPKEQRALLNLALRLDQDFGAFTTWNHDRRSPHLVDLVEETYQPEEGSRRAKLTTAQQGMMSRLTARWIVCEKCDRPYGEHYADDKCPRS